MTIRVIKDARAGMGYRSDIRLMMFYLEVGGKERLLVALMPFGCKAENQDDFDVNVTSHTAHCRRDCRSCQFSRILEPMTFEEIEIRHGIRFNREPPPMSTLTASEIWCRVKFPPPASVQALLDQP